jgi:hypothetical protein
LEVVLEEDPQPEILAAALSRTLPEGLRIENAARLPSARPARLAAVVWRFPAPPVSSPPPTLPGGFELEEEAAGTCRVKANSPDGTDPPGVRMVAHHLARGGDPLPYLLGAELVRTDFVDGM